MITEKQKLALNRIKYKFVTINDFDIETRNWIKKLIDAGSVEVGDIRNYLEITDANYNKLTGVVKVVNYNPPKKKTKLLISYSVRQKMYLVKNKDKNIIYQYFLNKEKVRRFIYLENLENIENQLKELVIKSAPETKDLAFYFQIKRSL